MQSFRIGLRLELIVKKMTRRLKHSRGGIVRSEQKEIPEKRFLKEVQKITAAQRKARIECGSIPP